MPHSQFWNKAFNDDRPYATKAIVGSFYCREEEYTQHFYVNFPRCPFLVCWGEWKEVEKEKKKNADDAIRCGFGLSSTSMMILGNAITRRCLSQPQLLATFLFFSFSSWLFDVAGELRAQWPMVRCDSSEIVTISLLVLQCVDFCLEKSGWKGNYVFTRTMQFDIYVIGALGSVTNQRRMCKWKSLRLPQIIGFYAMLNRSGFSRLEINKRVCIIRHAWQRASDIHFLHRMSENHLRRCHSKIIPFSFRYSVDWNKLMNVFRFVICHKSMESFLRDGYDISLG